MSAAAAARVSDNGSGANSGAEENGIHHEHEGNEAPKIELLSAWFCPYAQRAWIALEEKCAEAGEGFVVTESMEQRKPNIMAKTALLLEKNPRGKVPTIIDRRGGDEAVVVESLICVEWVDESVGGPNQLLPGSPAQRADARTWAQRLNDEVCTPFYSLLKGQDEERQVERILAGLRDFSKRCKGPFFYGEDISIVDIAIAPWWCKGALRMDTLEHYRGFTVPRTAEYEAYWQWSDAMSKHPSFVATASSNLQGMIDVYLPYSQGVPYTMVSWGTRPHPRGVKRRLSKVGEEGRKRRTSCEV